MPATIRRLYGMAAAVLLAVAAIETVHGFTATLRTKLAFDDAYMFMRYAHNVRHGLGYAWNPDGVPTYGPTSLLWSLCTLLLNYLPLDLWTQLLLGSWLCSAAAMVALAWAIATNARTPFLCSTYRVLPLLVVPFATTTAFAANQFTGMETMLAMCLCSLFCGAALCWADGHAHPALVGALAFLLVLARPESALVGLLMPAMLWLWPVAHRPAVKGIAILYAVFLGAVAAELICCTMYFGTPVPLSVYLKGGHAYAGYGGVWHPELLLLTALESGQVYLAALILLVRRGDRRLLAACLVPVAAVFGYLQTVTQIMGFSARYYAPYLPLILVPAVLVMDRRIHDGALPPARALRRRGAVVALMLLFFLGMSSEATQGWVRRAENHSRDAYDSANLAVAAKAPLPRIDWQPMMMAVTDRLVAPLPPGVTVAATEVGYLGAYAPQANIIDIAGLNDTEIARHGFRMDALLQRSPDIVWMPHTDYTWQRGIMLSDPALLQRYDLYADAANYGLAIRKDSPYRESIGRQMKIFWQATYPGYRMEDYRVTAATWSGQKHTMYGE